MKVSYAPCIFFFPPILIKPKSYFAGKKDEEGDTYERVQPLTFSHGRDWGSFIKPHLSLIWCTFRLIQIKKLLILGGYYYFSISFENLSFVNLGTLFAMMCRIEGKCLP